MNMAEMVNELAAKSDVTKALAAQMVGHLFDTITHELAAGHDVKIPGFGNFTSTERRASAGRNPRTGMPIDIPARRSPKLKPAKALREAVNPPQPVVLAAIRA